jgi:exopolyphosphatase/guanosine-5'-triphosphate,3'-diphosphate pyrophosphatase
MDDVILKAKRLGVHDEHIAKVKVVGDRLFKKFQKLHKLDARWKKYLLAAAIIHPAGKSISQANRDQHSYYIAKNADIPLMTEWENEIIAQLCLCRKAGKADDVLLPESIEKDRHAFFKLLSILKVIDALDRRNGPLVSIGRVSVRGKDVVMDVSAPRGDTTLEILRLEQKRDLFEDVFNKRLIARKRE